MAIHTDFAERQLFRDMVITGIEIGDLTVMDIFKTISQVAIPLPRGVRTQQSAPGVGHAGKTGQGQQGQGG